MPNPLAGIPGIPQGTPLNFTGSPTPFTGADLLSMLPAIKAGLTSNLDNSNPSLTNIEILKQGNTFVSPADLPAWSSQHASRGLQRELACDLVVSADFVFRHIIHGGMGPVGLDLNHFNSVRGPVIPRCSGAQQNDPHALCSTGPIQVWQSTSSVMAQTGSSSKKQRVLEDSILPARTQQLESEPNGHSLCAQAS